ncbi:MAG TPA: SDR family NAD(P)-dependent oxidoreductase [Ramlibacter sp.]|uniref:SDR family NAD(P)-dependent oxidoreductase n=1 Tax=Ramlibacter sp. TaxID=1917967 RepID=UPI002B58510B|nr:SDR family NAD(P)-dependent oxidoreductase [Ramlibacter sp.]HVZ45956.1 SDR family NAD(P)-dependent oxidoreductase [Ramlibacter sp.]
MSRFDSKVVAITGGGGGIGVAFTKRFAQEGAHVVVLDATESIVAAGVQAVEGRATGIVVDVGDETSVDNAFAQIQRRHGRLDVLVCGAGVKSMGRVAEHDLAVWKRCIDINLTGLFLCNRAASRMMLAQGGGAIVNIASVNGVRACEGMAAYNASKAGVISLTQTLACELAPMNVRVNAILPAQVETPMTAEQVGAERARREERIPMGRYGKPHEIAAAAAYLASDDASFVTGHCLATDGGYLAFGFRPQTYI